MNERHSKECSETKQELEVQLSPKVKETSELLNLRKMEEHMVKQKMYFKLYLDFQRLIKYNNRSSKWREKKKECGWIKEMKKCKLLSILSKTSRILNSPILGKSIKICLMNQSEIEKLKKKDCIRNSRIFIKISRPSKTKKL